MAKKKARKRAEEFIQAIGTSGGPIGSPGLFAFGGTDVQQQIFSGNSDQYASIRMRQGDTRVGNAAAMPSDLDASYLKLNLPGSPLPANGLFAPNYMNQAEFNQDQMLAQQQYFRNQFVNPIGYSQLPVGFPPAPPKKGRR